MSLKKHIPNFITSLRILGTVCIIFLTPLEVPFFIAYTATGVTDVLDGLIARVTHSTSSFGARLDSVADLLFYTITLIKLLPILWARLPSYIWIIVAVILILRTTSYIISAIKFHRFASHHTILNKATGVMVFAIPYFLLTPPSFATAFCLAVCLIGFLSTSEDLYIHISTNTYDENVKTVFKIR